MVSTKGRCEHVKLVVTLVGNSEGIVHVMGKRIWLAYNRWSRVAVVDEGISSWEYMLMGIKWKVLESSVSYWGSTEEDFLVVDGAKYICGYYRAASVGSAGGMVKDSSVYIDW